MRVPVLVTLVSLSATACGGPVPERLNNGDRGEISLAVSGIPAEHQPFEVLISVKARPMFCNDGDACITMLPIVGMAAGCDDEAVCSVKQQEPTEEGRQCRVVIDAGKAGETRLMLEVETESGELRRDTFLIKVAQPTAVEVACEQCGMGMAPGEETRATCSLFNRDVSPEPLLGTCDAWSTGRGVEVIGLGEVSVDGTRKPRVAGAAPSSTGRTFGNVFTIRKTMAEGAEVVFSGGDVEQHLMTR